MACRRELFHGEFALLFVELSNILRDVIIPYMLDSRAMYDTIAILFDIPRDSTSELSSRSTNHCHTHHKLHECESWECSRIKSSLLKKNP